MTIVSDTIVSNGQTFYVSAPTSAYNTTVYAGGAQFVYDGGYARDLRLGHGNRREQRLRPGFRGLFRRY